jgi:hypothetical protein
MAPEGGTMNAPQIGTDTPTDPSPAVGVDHDRAGAVRAALPDEVRRAVGRASELCRRRTQPLREAFLATSVAAVDELLGGGLPRGAMVELVGRGSCGRFSTLLAVLQQATSAGSPAALVDQGAQLDPQTAAAVGIDLDRLLWLRPGRLDDTLAAAEMLVATGFELVALDLGLPPVLGRPPLAAWLRLARSAAEHRTVVLVGTPYRLSGCAAAVVLSGGHGRGRWSGAVGGLRLLDGLTARLELDKHTTSRDRSNRHSTAAFTAPDAAFRGTITVPSINSPARRQRHVQNL